MENNLLKTDSIELDFWNISYDFFYAKKGTLNQDNVSQFYDAVMRLQISENRPDLFKDPKAHPSCDPESNLERWNVLAKTNKVNFDNCHNPRLVNYHKMIE